MSCPATADSPPVRRGLTARAIMLAAVLGLPSAGCPTPVDPQGMGCEDEAASPGEDPGVWSAVARLNCYRDAMGLPRTSLDSALNEAAMAHAQYLDATSEFGHEELDPDHPAFTGATPSDRVFAAGYPLDDHEDSLSELVGFRNSGADGAEAVDLWMRTAYHRPPLTIPQLDGIGFGQSGIFDVMLVVAPWEASFDSPPFEVGRYPAPGQTGVPTEFDSDREEPDPIPDRGVVGFPVSLSFLDQGFVSPDDLYGIVVDLEATEVTDPTGAQVPTTALEPATDPLLRRTVVLVPDQPLEPNTTYTTALHGTVGETVFSQSWSFSTEE